MAHTGAVLRALSDDLVLADPSEFTSLLRAGIDQIEMTCDLADEKPASQRDMRARRIVVSSYGRSHKWMDLLSP